ncbi:hypothetical protein T492DRAFT_1149280 [Pavlovales sp. CCMP2436]|nr:hypothetical protein T492DRAFT_1149280 [Pavlovales sp. CCMP2436]|mmetsp:Transcript_11507/g.26931  ORF Transcript_11507/g.26931 Transcript_11507/m.26931 type:complete len:458 (-) Transcript_11507:37-1410(-)
MRLAWIALGFVAGVLPPPTGERPHLQYAGADDRPRLVVPGCVLPTLHKLPMESDMAEVLASTRLHLSDRAEVISRGSGACPAVATVMAGLPRMCGHAPWVRRSLGPCLRGETSVTMAFQGQDHFLLKSTVLKQFNIDSCLTNLRAATSGTACRLIFVHTTIRPDNASGPCDESSLTRADVRKRSRRVMAQTIAIGRAWTWARRFHPDAKTFVRARLDSTWCLPKWAEMNRSLVVVDFQSTQDSLVEGGRRFAGDNFGLVSSDIAPAYFEAWRVWSKLDCSRICLMGSGTAECATSYLPRIGFLSLGCSGEFPLTAHLCEHAAGRGDLAENRCAASGNGGQSAVDRQRPTWRRIARQPNPYFIPVGSNDTLVAKRRNARQPLTFAAAAALMDMREYHPVYGMCKPCGTDCLYTLQSTPRDWPLKKLNGLPPHTLPCATDYDSDVCLYLGQERDTSCRA